MSHLPELLPAAAKSKMVLEQATAALHMGDRHDAERLLRKHLLEQPRDAAALTKLAELVIEMTGSRSPLINLPLPSDDPTQRKPDISVARRELSWEPTVPLRQGLEQTIAYFRTLL